MNFKKLMQVKNIINRQSLILISLLTCLISLLILNLSLFFYAPKQTIEAKEDTSSSQIAFWQNFLELHPTYFEGWVQLSKLEYSNGNRQQSVYYFQKAFSINPNSSDLDSLKIKLGL